ncbi:unnamed protein product, partial [Rotaria sp. Silwood2]
FAWTYFLQHNSVRPDGFRQILRPHIVHL